MCPAARLHWLALEIVPLLRGVGRPRPDRRSKLLRRCRPGWMVSCCLMVPAQLRIRQPLADQPAGERRHLVVRVPVPLVQAPCELAEVPRQVLHLDAVVHAVMAALEQGPKGLDPVCMHAASHVFADLVPRRLVPVPFQTLVRRMLVGVHGGLRRGERRDELMQGALVGRAATTAARTCADSRSRAPTTAVLPTGLRPARSFLAACLLGSLPPR